VPETHVEILYKPLLPALYFVKFTCEINHLQNWHGACLLSGSPPWAHRSTINTDPKELR